MLTGDSLRDACLSRFKLCQTQNVFFRCQNVHLVCFGGTGLFFHRQIHMQVTFII